MSARAILSTTFRWASDWRTSIIAYFPDDPRNEIAASGLLNLAQWVEVLPKDDPLLVRLNKILLRHQVLHLEALGVSEASRYEGFSPLRDKRRFADSVLDDFEEELAELFECAV